MFKNYSITDLAVIAVLLEEEDEAKKKSKRKARKTGKRKIWLHKSLLERKTEGEFFTLYKELLDDEVKFHQYFRMSKYQFNDLLSKLEHLLRKRNTTFRQAITPVEKLALCLRFLATGDTMRSLAFSYRLGHSTVWSIIKEVCNAINSKMLKEQMPLPNENDWKKIGDDFWRIWNFPNCLGALDGKHVQIEAPANSGSQYFNYKKTFSVVLMALVDAEYKFIAVDIGAYGKNSDGGIFANSSLGQRFHNNTINIPPGRPLPNTNTEMPFVMVGDEAFPLKTYLLRPYPGSQIKEDAAKTTFNYRLSRARRVVENTFGILAQRFQVYRRILKSKPEYADQIILATCILHNYIRDGNIYTSRTDVLHQTQFTDIPPQGGSAQRTAYEIRETFKTFISSPQGALPWEV